MPLDFVTHTTVLPDGRVLVAGYQRGVVGLVLLNPTNLQLDGPILLPDRDLHLQSCAIASPRQVLITGFLGENGVLVAVDPFTTANLSAPQVRRAMPSTVSLDGNAVLVAGGLVQVDPSDVGGSPTDLATIYHPASDQWTNAAPMPGARTLAKGVWCSSIHPVRTEDTGRAVVFGGSSPAANPDQLCVDVYDPSLDDWTRYRPRWAPPMLPEPARWAALRGIVARQRGETGDEYAADPYHQWNAAASMADGSVVFFLDATDGRITVGLDIMAVLDPSSGAWSDPIPARRARRGSPGSAVAGLPDGRLVTRGYAKGGMECLHVWSPADGWTRGPAPRFPGGRRLAALPDGRVVVGVDRDRSLEIMAV